VHVPLAGCFHGKIVLALNTRGKVWTHLIQLLSCPQSSQQEGNPKMAIPPALKKFQFKTKGKGKGGKSGKKK
jgi:hypothetical protein